MRERMKPQACQSTYAPRLRVYNNSLLTPSSPSAPAGGPISRTTKRGTTIINYAEDGYDDLESEEDGGGRRRRPTGLRSSLREETTAGPDLTDKVGKDTAEPVDMQGISRDWMARPRYHRSDQHDAIQANLPLTLVPIRIDLEVPSFIPQAPWPPVPGVDMTLPQFRPQEMTAPYRIRDWFLWNLHEAAITTDHFAITMVQDLDLPNRSHTVAEISKQIRSQLEEYAGVALHPLFHTKDSSHGMSGQNAVSNGVAKALAGRGGDETPTPFARAASRQDTPMANSGMATPSKVNKDSASTPLVTAEATTIEPEDPDDESPDDTYRCVVNLNITLSSMMYTDRFEWSLLHPAGTAEAFAKVTCADLGLNAEWVPAITHAIYEAVLRLKKEACESGGFSGYGAQNELQNHAANAIGAGWRYDPEHLGDEWEPKVEALTKEEMEKREIDRERQVRRLRRETARFSSTTGLPGGATFTGVNSAADTEEERMGRGERNRRKKRFRSLSPLGRSGTPGGRGTPDVAAGSGYGGGGTLTDHERLTWRCTHCGIPGTSVWAVRDGPYAPRSLCHNCGMLYEHDRTLPRQLLYIHGRPH